MRASRSLVLLLPLFCVVSLWRDLGVECQSSAGMCSGGGPEDSQSCGGAPSGGSCGGPPPPGQGGTCGGAPPSDEAGSEGGYGTCGGGPPEGGSDAGGGQCGGPPGGGADAGGGQCGGPPGGGADAGGGQCGGPPAGGADAGGGQCGGGAAGGAAADVPRSMESKIKFRKLLRKIDADKDKKISEKELKDWIENMSKEFLRKEGKKSMEMFDNNMDGFVTWDEYANRQGYVKDDLSEPNKEREVNKGRDKKRFVTADLNKDNKLDAEELGMMQTPEESPLMADVVVSEYLEFYDKDKDGLIDKDEYIGDDPDGKPMDKETAESLKSQFEIEDKDKSGKLDRNEILDMIVLPNEASDLIKLADTDKDGFVDEKEVFKRYVRFVQSRVTMYGELIKEEKKEKKEDKKGDEKVKKDEKKDQKKDEL